VLAVVSVPESGSTLNSVLQWFLSEQTRDSLRRVTGPGTMADDDGKQTGGRSTMFAIFIFSMALLAAAAIHVLAHLRRCRWWAGVKYWLRVCALRHSWLGARSTISRSHNSCERAVRYEQYDYRKGSVAGLCRAACPSGCRFVLRVPAGAERCCCAGTHGRHVGARVTLLSILSNFRCEVQPRCCSSFSSPRRTVLSGASMVCIV
jgi:hypothetical protein